MRQTIYDFKFPKVIHHKFIEPLCQYIYINKDYKSQGSHLY